MTAVYPYTNPNGGSGYGTGARLPSAHVNTIWEQSAAAADGSMWTDTSMVRNWSDSFNVDSTYNVSLMHWDESQRKWWAFGRNSGTNAPLAYNSVGGKVWYAASVPASDGFAAAANRYAAASDGSGVIVWGSTPASASANKIRESADGGTNWNARTIGAADTVGVGGIRWIPHLSLFVAGLGSQANNLYTSTNGQTWTQRTTPNTDARSGIATDGSIVVVGNATAATTRVVTSADGITWTERTMPSSAQWNHVVWVENLEVFVAISFAGAVASSSDGVTWSSSGLASISATSITNVTTYGRVVVAAGADAATHPIVWSSIDGGVSWVRQYMFEGTAGASCVAYGDGQLLVSDAGAPSKHYTSLATGA